jgi:hypothetical protein
MVGGVLLLAGIALTIVSFYIYLTGYLPQSTVLMICGISALVISGGLLWIATKIMR